MLPTRADAIFTTSLSAMSTEGIVGKPVIENASGVRILDGLCEIVFETRDCATGGDDTCSTAKRPVFGPMHLD